jgi:acid phosphatase class B
MSPKAKSSGKYPYAHGADLVKKGLMSPEKFAEGIKNGTYRSDPNARDYGKDQKLYEQVQAVIDANAGQTQEFNFTVIGKHKRK